MKKQIEFEIELEIDYEKNIEIEEFIQPMKRVLERIIQDHQYEKEKFKIRPSKLSTYIALVDQDSIKEINLEHRGIDKATDVLSFPSTYSKKGKLIFDIFDLDQETKELFLGEIIISVDHIFKQAKEYNHSSLREAVFLASHGLLHLLGYDHQNKEEETEMINIQESLLKELGYGR